MSKSNAEISLIVRCSRDGLARMEATLMGKVKNPYYDGKMYSFPIDLYYKNCLPCRDMHGNMIQHEELILTEEERSKLSQLLDDIDQRVRGELEI